jgi:hypothetical protein
MSTQIHRLIEDSKGYVRSLFPHGDYKVNVNVEMFRGTVDDELSVMLCVERGLAKFVKKYSVSMHGNVYKKIEEIGPRFAQEAMRIKFNNTGGLR